MTYLDVIYLGWIANLASIVILVLVSIILIFPAALNDQIKFEGIRSLVEQIKKPWYIGVLTVLTPFFTMYQVLASFYSYACKPTNVDALDWLAEEIDKCLRK